MTARIVLTYSRLDTAVNRQVTGSSPVRGVEKLPYKAGVFRFGGLRPYPRFSTLTLMARLPQLRKHTSGNYFVRWGGKDHYLGRDRREAQNQYTVQLDLWNQWQAQKADARAVSATRTRLTVGELVKQFVESKRHEAGIEASEYYAKHLKRLTHRFNKIDVDLIEPQHLNALKLAMIQTGEYKPRTINHDLTAIRVMLNWAAGLGLAPNRSYKGVKNLPTGPVEDKTISAQTVAKLIRKADERLRPWVALNYLAVCRPSEVRRLVRREGEFVMPGVFRLDRGKMDRRASIKRHVILSDVALAWLTFAESHYNHRDAYSAAVKRQLGVGPKVIQKSAATHLVHDLGARPDDVELLLGHVRGRLAVTYYLPAFARLRETAALLGVQPVRE